MRIFAISAFRSVSRRLKTGVFKRFGLAEIRGRDENLDFSIHFEIRRIRDLVIGVSRFRNNGHPGKNRTQRAPTLLVNPNFRIFSLPKYF